MNGNVFTFPNKEKMTANTVLDDARDKLEDCIVLGVTKEGDAYYSVFAQDAGQVIFLLRALEHVVLTQELSGE